MRIHEISICENGVMSAGIDEVNLKPLETSSIFGNGIETAILVFAVLENSKYCNHISPEFKFTPPDFLTNQFLQDVPVIKTRQPRIEHLRIEEGRFVGDARHLFIAFFSKSFFDQVKPIANDLPFVQKLFSRILLDVEEFQIKTLIMDQLTLPDTKENYEWNKVLRDCEIWKRSLNRYLFPVNDCLVVCPKGNVWDFNLSQAKSLSTIMSYNVLAQSYTSSHYGYCKKHIGLETRTPKIVKLVDSIHADIQLYQEMESGMFEVLKKQNHYSLFKKKGEREEGLAILIDKRFWDITKEGSRQLIPGHLQDMIFVACRHKFTQKTLLVVCTHLIGDPNLLNIQTEQAQLLANWSIMTALQYECQNIIIGGDFNAGNESQAYKQVEQSGFKNALKEIHGKHEPPITFNTDKIHRAIDYLWFNFQTIKPCITTFNQQQFQIRVDQALPNQEHGSDHIPIFVKLDLL